MSEEYVDLQMESKQDRECLSIDLKYITIIKNVKLWGLIHSFVLLTY